MPKIIGLIPAAGKGSRLSPFPCPKELFPVGYQNFEVNGIFQRRPKVVSQYLIENIQRAGAERMAIIVSEGKDDIMKYYGAGGRFDTAISYFYQERQLGMPEALAIPYLWCLDAGTFLFGMPDTIIEPANAFSLLLDFHLSEKADLTLGLFGTDTPSKFGMVKTDRENNVVETIDKPQETALKWMWGCACWNHDFYKLLVDYVKTHPPGNKENILGDVFNAAIKGGMKVKGLPLPEGSYLDIGTADELDMALKKFHL